MCLMELLLKIRDIIQFGYHLDQVEPDLNQGGTYINRSGVFVDQVRFNLNQYGTYLN